MDIKPDVDCAIVCYETTMAINFSRLPDVQVSAEILSMDGKFGISIDHEREILGGFLVAGSSDPTIVSSPKKPGDVRTFYWIEIPFVFEVMSLGRKLAKCFREEYELTVKLVDARRDKDRELVAIFR